MDIFYLSYPIFRKFYCNDCPDMVFLKILHFQEYIKMTKELDNLIQKAAQVLKSFGATDVYLFGSMAKGTNTDHSDIDLAVTGIPPEKFYEAIGDTFGAIRREIDIIDLDEKTPFVSYLKEHGELHRVE
jgi:uncharacterized protein